MYVKSESVDLRKSSGVVIISTHSRAERGGWQRRDSKVLEFAPFQMVAKSSKQEEIVFDKIHRKSICKVWDPIWYDSTSLLKLETIF